MEPAINWTPGDRILLEAYFMSAVAAVRDDFLHYQKGLINRDNWEQRKRASSAYLLAGYANELWLHIGKLIEPEFYSELANLAEQHQEENYIVDMRDRAVAIADASETPDGS